MKKRLVLVMALVALLILGSTLPSFAQSEGVYGPFGFTLDRGFAEYTFTYAGDGSEISVELSFAPGDALAQRGVALKLYGPDGAVVETGEAEFGMVTITTSPVAEGTYTIEVANYHASLPLQFALVVRGDGISNVAAVEAVAEEPEVVAEEPAVVVEEPEVVAEEPAAVVEEPEAEDSEPAAEEPAVEAVPVAGVFGPYGFALNRGFANATFAYAGDGSDIVIDLSFAPGDTLAEAGVALKLYGPDGAVVETGDKSFGTATIEASPTAEGTYTIEVANYHENLPVQFSLIVRGAGVSNVSAVEVIGAVEAEAE